MMIVLTVTKVFNRPIPPSLLLFLMHISGASEAEHLHTYGSSIIVGWRLHNDAQADRIKHSCPRISI
jgi:hypothetical protein